MTAKINKRRSTVHSQRFKTESKSKRKTARQHPSRLRWSGLVVVGYRETC